MYILINTKKIVIVIRPVSTVDNLKPIGRNPIFNVEYLWKTFLVIHTYPQITVLAHFLNRQFDELNLH